LNHARAVPSAFGSSAKFQTPAKEIVSAGKEYWGGSVGAWLARAIEGSAHSALARKSRRSSIVIRLLQHLVFRCAACAMFCNLDFACPFCRQRL
jgi:rubrerythrin